MTYGLNAAAAQRAFEKEALEKRRIELAAPELYQALKGARLMLYAWKGSRLPEWGPHPELERTIREVEAAILGAKPMTHNEIIIAEYEARRRGYSEEAARLQALRWSRASTLREHAGERRRDQAAGSPRNAPESQ